MRTEKNKKKYKQFLVEINIISFQIEKWWTYDYGSFQIYLEIVHRISLLKESSEVGLIDLIDQPSQSNHQAMKNQTNSVFNCWVKSRKEETSMQYLVSDTRAFLKQCVHFSMFEMDCGLFFVNSSCTVGRMIQMKSSLFVMSSERSFTNRLSGFCLIPAKSIHMLVSKKTIPAGSYRCSYRYFLRQYFSIEATSKMFGSSHIIRVADVSKRNQYLTQGISHINFCSFWFSLMHLPTLRNQKRRSRTSCFEGVNSFRRDPVAPITNSPISIWLSWATSFFKLSAFTGPWIATSFLSWLTNSSAVTFGTSVSGNC